MYINFPPSTTFHATISAPLFILFVVSAPVNLVNNKHPCTFSNVCACYIGMARGITKHTMASRMSNNEKLQQQKYILLLFFSFISWKLFHGKNDKKKSKYKTKPGTAQYNIFVLQFVFNFCNFKCLRFWFRLRPSNNFSIIAFLNALFCVCFWFLFLFIIISIFGN